MKPSSLLVLLAISSIPLVAAASRPPARPEGTRAAPATPVAPVAPAPAPAPAPVTLESLLEEMIDFDAVARWPDPPYTCRQASSYDRKSVGPGKPGWFANADNSKFIRVEERRGRKEHVLMEADGPGAIVRFWLTSTAKPGTLRIYLDAADTPAIEFPAYDLMTGPLNAGSPLVLPHTSYNPTGGGGNTLYLPIPYAKRCEVTWEDPDPGKMPPRYYQIDYRTYAEGTRVESFTMQALARARPRMEKVGATLKEPPAFKGGRVVHFEARLTSGPGKTMSLPLGPAAVKRLEIGVRVEREEDLPQALRSTLLRMGCDGERTIWCPVGDFSGSGVGGRPFASWYRTVEKDGRIVSRWVMPYERSAQILVVNLGASPVDVWMLAHVDEWNWDQRSMYFHASWRQEVGIPMTDKLDDAVAPPIDWNFVTLRGQGVLVGDSLALFNPIRTWYGEGDEKIWVDGEAFPSHFGTGTEDYYNASWAPVVPFHTPFAAAPRADDPSSQGHNTFTRTRNLDGIPFRRSLQFDMEVISWKPGKVDYAATTYWYARPGASVDVPPIWEEAARRLSEVPGRARLPGAIECETMELAARADGLVVETQDLDSIAPERTWSAGCVLLARGRKVGDFVELRVPVPGAGPKRLTVRTAKSFDYGILRFSVDGRAIGRDLDTYSADIVPSDFVELGTIEPRDGRIVLRVEVVGCNPQSRPPNHYFGLDCVQAVDVSWPVREFEERPVGELVPPGWK